MDDFRRWYDKDPILKEALELLQMQPDETKSNAADFIIKLQEQVAQDVIESVYDMVSQYAGKGSRWYDNDPVMLKAVELLRVAPPETQRNAALKLLKALENNSLEDINLNKDD
ncbi:MAG: hypothetical protein PHV37_06170 [Candidatus Gastranaerophilales bacterium]|nr:hypothetical protein [Candidatus Gastranaerophilales bacterium]